MSTGEFEERLQAALKNYYDQADRVLHYRRVRAVLVCWNRDMKNGLSIGNLVHYLGDVLERPYNYAIDKLALEDNPDVGDGLENTLLRVMRRAEGMSALGGRL